MFSLDLENIAAYRVVFIRGYKRWYWMIKSMHSSYGVGLSMNTWVGSFVLGYRDDSRYIEGLCSVLGLGLGVGSKGSSLGLG